MPTNSERIKALETLVSQLEAKLATLQSERQLGSRGELAEQLEDRIEELERLRMPARPEASRALARRRDDAAASCASACYFSPVS